MEICGKSNRINIMTNGQTKQLWIVKVPAYAHNDRRGNETFVDVVNKKKNDKRRNEAKKFTCQVFDVGSH